MRKGQNTSITERSNVEHDLWRKKVDNSLFRHKGTVVPKWVASKWKLDKHFPDIKGKLGKNDKKSETQVLFKRKTYSCHVTCTLRKNRPNKVHRLWFSEELVDELKEVFVMSHMRDIESALRGDVGDLEKEIPFWEMIDIEFDPKNRHFILTGHYTHQPMFPELFSNLAGSPALKAVEDQVLNKKDFRIHKQDWKPKDKLDTELGAVNVIYTLCDRKNKLIYVGEAKDLRKRLKQKYPSIPSWTHYRYDVLPKGVSDTVRVSIERMTIRSYANLFKNKSNVDSIEISNYSLANDKIDK
jgi:hypothetical protein